MKKFAVCTFASIVCIAVLVTAANAQDAVADWNAISQKTVKAGAHPLPVTSVELAIVQLAIYDAVESIDGRYVPYYAVVPGASGSMSAATARAGRDALIGLFPGQTAAIDADYAQFLATNGIDPGDPGIGVGAQAAANILALRTGDGRFPQNQTPFVGGTAIAQWRPTPSYLPGAPPSFAPGVTPWLANVSPFAISSDSQFRVDAPPDLTSDTWAEDYNEVLAVGALNSSVRTPEQTDIGYFWADSGPALWQNAMRYLARHYLHNLGDSARMFALGDAAIADAQIACWDSKYFYDRWRPITAIRLGDQDGNAATPVEPNWQPLINTPNFPEYPSGHASVSGAASRVLRLFFGTDDVMFQMTTANPQAQQTTRTFTGFSQAEDEVIDARVYVGIHFRTSDRAARAQGLQVANWVFKHYFQAIGDASSGAR